MTTIYSSCVGALNPWLYVIAAFFLLTHLPGILKDTSCPKECNEQGDVLAISNQIQAVVPQTSFLKGTRPSPMFSFTPLQCVSLEGWPNFGVQPILMISLVCSLKTTISEGLTYRTLPFVLLFHTPSNNWWLIHIVLGLITMIPFHPSPSHCSAQPHFAVLGLQEATRADGASGILVVHSPELNRQQGEVVIRFLEKRRWGIATLEWSKIVW